MQDAEKYSEDRENIYQKCFISFDFTSDNAYSFFINNLSKKTKGLCITRNHPDEIAAHHGNDFEIHWMSQKNKGKGNLMEELERKIKKFIGDNENSVILLERIDYLMNLYGFEQFLKFIYGMHEEVLDKNAVLLVHSHPLILTEHQKQLLGLELKELPQPEYMEKIKVAVDLYDILGFLKTQDAKVSFKTIGKKFSITKATARKRIYELSNRGLVNVKKDGRSKIVELTRKGFAVL
ncbi:DUF835 domain-containing protein [Candidatus Woesearchaeota archaeon]|nr:MAG: DUF835 domain-containing protein [Candidatus Woesearchaeota archaeon]